MNVFWLCAAAVFGIAEAVTTQLVSIWFVGGSVCAFAAALLGADIIVQTAVFVAVSALLLICTRSFVKKLTKNKQHATNTDALIGKTAVISVICGDRAEVKLDGKYWSICPESGAMPQTGEKVTVKGIEGVKLIVAPCNDTAEV